VRHSLEGESDSSQHPYWKLDMYEDHQRRRFRFVRNYAGSYVAVFRAIMKAQGAKRFVGGRSHPEASIEAKRGSRPSSMALDNDNDEGGSADGGYV
jgi:hypothetical protein